MAGATSIQRYQDQELRAPHFQYHVSGVLRVRMDDGARVRLQSGRHLAVAVGHDAWVVGDEPRGGVDFQGMID